MKRTHKSSFSVLGYRFEFYKTSERPAYKYPHDYEVLKVGRQGNIRWMKKDIYIRASLAGEYIGLKKIDEQYYEVYFGSKLIDTLDRLSLRIV